MQPRKVLDQTFTELEACGGEKTKEERNVTGVEKFRKRGTSGGGFCKSDAQCTSDT